MGTPFGHPHNILYPPMTAPFEKEKPCKIWEGSVQRCGRVSRTHTHTHLILVYRYCISGLYAHPNLGAPHTPHPHTDRHRTPTPRTQTDSALALALINHAPCTRTPHSAPHFAGWEREKEVDGKRRKGKICRISERKSVELARKNLSN